MLFSLHHHSTTHFFNLILSTNDHSMCIFDATDRIDQSFCIIGRSTTC